MKATHNKYLLRRCSYDRFNASTQYDDLKGRIAADNADNINVAKWLTDNGYISDNEFVVGVSLFIGENHGKHKDPVNATFLVTQLNGFNTIPEMLDALGDDTPFREIRIQMGVTDFLSLFKRVHLTLSNGGILEGQKINAIEQNH